MELPAYRADDLDDVPKSATSAGRMANFHRIRDAGKWNEAAAAYLACIKLHGHQHRPRAGRARRGPASRQHHHRSVGLFASTGGTWCVFSPQLVLID
jgi:hypothetical protein